MDYEIYCLQYFTAGRSNKSILKEINPEYSLERLMLMLKLQYLGHLIWRAGSLEKALMLGKIKCRRRGWQTRWLDGVTNSMGMSLNQLQEIMKNREVWYAAVHGVAKNQAWLSNWITETDACIRRADYKLYLDLWLHRGSAPHPLWWSRISHTSNWWTFQLTNNNMLYWLVILIT